MGDYEDDSNKSDQSYSNLEEAEKAVRIDSGATADIYGKKLEYTTIQYFSYSENKRLNKSAINFSEIKDSSKMLGYPFNEINSKKSFSLFVFQHHLPHFDDICPKLKKFMSIDDLKKYLKQIGKFRCHFHARKVEQIIEGENNNNGNDINMFPPNQKIKIRYSRNGCAISGCKHHYFYPRFSIPEYPSDLTIAEYKKLVLERRNERLEQFENEFKRALTLHT